MNILNPIAPIILTLTPDNPGQSASGDASLNKKPIGTQGTFRLHITVETDGIPYLTGDCVLGSTEEGHDYIITRLGPGYFPAGEYMVEQAWNLTQDFLDNANLIIFDADTLNAIEAKVTLHQAKLIISAEIQYLPIIGIG